MTYRSYFYKVKKAILNLSITVDLEEDFYIQEDARVLNDLLEGLDSKLKTTSAVVSLKDFVFKEKCLELIDEAKFYLAEANDVLQS